MDMWHTSKVKESWSRSGDDHHNGEVRDLHDISHAELWDLAVLLQSLPVDRWQTIT